MSHIENLLVRNLFQTRHSLRKFVRSIGQNKNLSDVQAKQVDEFLAGKGPITTNWHTKHSALRGFYRYVLSRGYTKEAPLPVVIPKRPQSLVPYIYNVKELRAIFDAALTYQKELLGVDLSHTRFV